MKKLLLLLFLVLAGTGAHAQYYSNNPTQSRMARQVRNTPRANNKKKEKIDIVELTVNDLAKKLELDDFQKAAVTVIYNDNKDDIFGIADEDIPTAAKKEKAKEITEKIDAEIMELLNDTQKKKYQEIIDERRKY